MEHEPRPAGNPALVADIRAEIANGGPITFARFMELALYHPVHGYYRAPDRRPGRGGDFITAPELHPFFGLTIARFVLDCWDRLGRPEPFTVREVGSGVGGLAYDVIAGVLDARPELRSVLRYWLDDVNPHRSRQALRAMREVGLGDVVAVAPSATDSGGITDRITDSITGVVIANEVADALPVHRLVWDGSALREIGVTWRDGRFADEIGPLSPEVLALDLPRYLARHGVDPAAWPAGSRIEVCPALEPWIADAGAGLARGYALIVDYGYPAVELYHGHRLDGTLRAYRQHRLGTDPLDHVGEQDLTAHVDFSRLVEAAERAGFAALGLTTQADFLAGAGLGELLVTLQRQPDTAIEEYYRAQAAVFRLIDPAGMGRFRVLGLAKAAPGSAPLAGFAGSDLPAAPRFP